MKGVMSFIQWMLIFAVIAVITLVVMLGYWNKIAEVLAAKGAPAFGSLGILMRRKKGFEPVSNLMILVIMTLVVVFIMFMVAGGFFSEAPPASSNIYNGFVDAIFGR